MYSEFKARLGYVRFCFKEPKWGWEQTKLKCPGDPDTALPFSALGIGVIL